MAGPTRLPGSLGGGGRQGLTRSYVMTLAMACSEGKSSSRAACRAWWLLTSPRASTCWQMAQTQQSRPAACWGPACHALFLLLLALVLGGFSRMRKSVCAVSSSCCLAVSGRSASSSPKIFWKLSPRRSRQLW